MIEASKTIPIKNSENNISNIQLNSIQNCSIKQPTQNLIENWLLNNQSTSLNSNLLNTNNWSSSMDSSFVDAIAASVNELYGSGVSPQFFLQKQQQLLYNQQHMLSNVAGTSIQQQQSFKGNLKNFNII